VAEIFPNEGLDVIFGYFPKNGTLPANTWLALFTAYTASTVGDSTSTRASYTEPAAGGYARQTISSASWGAAATTQGGRGAAATQVTFPTATAGWGTINGFFSANALTVGTSYFAANFDDTTAITVNTNDIVKVTPTMVYTG